MNRPKCNGHTDRLLSDVSVRLFTSIKQISLSEKEDASSRDKVSLEGTEKRVMELGKHDFQSCSQRDLLPSIL
jgi:hypothetical protein